jgi:putative inorganic carbon (HCO3(-)) transporter
MIDKGHDKRTIRFYYWTSMGFVFTLIYIAVGFLSPRFIPDPIVQLHIEVLICALAVLGTVIELPRSRLFSTPEAYLLLGLLVAVAASRVANGWMGGGIDAISEFLPSAITFYLVAVNFRSLKRLRILTVVMVAIGLYIVVSATVAYEARDVSSPYLVLEKVDEGNAVLRFRGLGFLSDPNDTAQYLIAIIPLLWIGWRKRHALSSSVLVIVPAGFLLFGIVMTHSRGAAFALMVLALFLFRDRLGLGRAAVVAGLALALLIAAGISGGRGITEDNGGRMEAWSLGLTLLRSSPLFGIGYGQFADYNNTGLSAHNSFILCLSELGIFGYLFWIGLLVYATGGLNSIINENYRHTQANDMKPKAFTDEAPVTSEVASNDIKPHTSRRILFLEERLYATVIRASLVGFLAAGFFISRTYAMMLYVLLGMAVSIRHISEQGTLPLPLRHGLSYTLAALACSVAVLYTIARLHWAL